MIPRALRWAYVVPIVTAQLFAFFTLFEIDQDRFVGPTYVIKVTATAESAPSINVSRALRTTAHERQSSIAREVTDPQNPNGHRTLAVASDDQHSIPGRWLRSGYADFDPSKRTTITRLREDSSDPRGYYYTFGSRDDADAYSDQLRDLGYETTVGHHESLLEMSLWTVGGSGLTAAISVGLLVVVLAAGGVLGAPRAVAIPNLVGMTRCRRLQRTSMGVIRSIAPWLATAVLATGGLWIYNDLAQYRDYFVVCTVLGLLFSIPVAITHGASSWFVGHHSIAKTIRADRPPTLAAWLAAGSRVPGTVLVVAAVFSAVQTTAATQTVHDLRAERSAAGPTASLWVSGNLGDVTESDTFWEKLGRLVRDATRREEAFLASGGSFPLGNRPDLGTLPLLIVDDGYLERESVLDVEGRRVLGTSRDVRVMVPPKLRPDWPDITDALKKWTFRGPEGQPAPDLTAGTLAANQKLYTFSTDAARIAPWVRDPVVVIVPRGSTDFSDVTYGSWITSGEVLFNDVGTAESAIARHNLREIFLAVVAIAQEAADREHEIVGAQRISLVTVLGALTVSILSAGATVVLALRRFGSALFARHMHGWTFVRTHRPILVLESFLLGIALIVGLNTYWAERADSRGLRSELDPSVAIAPIALATAISVSLLITIASLILSVVASRRAIRSRAKDA